MLGVRGFAEAPGAVAGDAGESKQPRPHFLIPQQRLEARLLLLLPPPPT